MAEVLTLQQIEDQHPGFKAFCLDQFVGNECGSDEYRETQPEKGLRMIAEWAEVQDRVLGYEAGDVEMLRLVREWLDAIIRAHGEDHTADPWNYAYAGAEELEPVLRVYFDALWEVNRHPYGYEGTPVMLIEDFLDTQA